MIIIKTCVWLIIQFNFKFSISYSENALNMQDRLKQDVILKRFYTYSIQLELADSNFDFWRKSKNNIYF